ncbi:3-deoxy-D-manno-octulosonic acid transferase [Opitutus terrae]|uniref:3-deoxy-D-manno-octulosonic acid transferase n=1 Tax=Opitutus terrae (strain DSM 11246 / JCM 15787 / PB90-1) TaxID=452637 RepID=B1ZT26_OPITP|nr:3-deoxy-D-manno-octulosonic acid transferase [Opitutus terrae]ACB75815.1 Three-deoxy-D-manno-octulosonic-acid transferase domain protein [Opitutus terrae PB90-1]
MFWFYRIVFLPALLVLAPRYLWRMRRRGGYRQKFQHRFGRGHDLPPKRPGVRRIWLQAVSVGEVLAIAPLLEALIKSGEAEVYLTTTTSTGHRLADERYFGFVIGLGYFPIDWWLFSRRAWRDIDPDMVILMEGERWPEHIHQANLRQVPVISINARTSDRSFRRLRNFGFANRLLFGGIDRLLPCSAQDEARFRQLGVPAEKIFTTGNIKLDLRIPRLTQAERTTLRTELGGCEGFVLLGSSTWPGEEAALLEAWQAARNRGVECTLLLVPRHAERRGELERLLREAQVGHHFRSRGPAPCRVAVTVADTTGELRTLTQLADLVFIGKSLPPNEGGQTPVEAAALEKPILFGPEMSNFRTIARELVAAGAARQVTDQQALTEVVCELLADPARRERMAGAAGEWQRNNAGAVERTLAVIREELARLK